MATALPRMNMALPLMTMASTMADHGIDHGIDMS